MRTTTRWLAAALVAAASLLAACTGEGTSEPPGPASPSVGDVGALKVAFVRDLSGGETEVSVAPALQAATLAFESASLHGGLVEVELVPFDTGGDPAGATEVAAAIASDEAFVAALGAPYLDGQAALGDAFDAVGVPWIALSGAGSGLGDRGWTGWRRLVADQVAQGTVLAQTADEVKASARGVCLMGDGTAAGRSLLDAAARALRAEVVLRAAVAEDQVDVASAVQSVAGAGCGVVVWGGDGSGGAALRRQLGEGSRRMTFVGSDRIRDQGFLEAVGSAGEGTLATCPCVDISTSTNLAAQRFIQDYQSEFGLAPGPYAVEAWDAARMLVAAFRGGAVTREAVRTALEVMTTFDGLAQTYRFELGGDLADTTEVVRLSAVEGGRWLELSTRGGSDRYG